METRAATGSEILEILREHSAELKRRLRLSDVQFSLPTDGKGLRIKVSLRRQGGGSLPSRIEFPLGEVVVAVPLEVAHDYQDYQVFR